MRSFKRVILPVFCLLFILAVANTVLNYALIPYSYVRIMMHQITTENYDTVLLGTSHGLNGISPKILEEQTGEKTINLCLGGEYPRDAYYLLRQVCKKKLPKKVVYELDPGYWCTKEGQRGDFNRIYYEMPWSEVKFEYFVNKMLKLDFRATLFPWFYYRGQLKNTVKIISCKQSKDYKNFGVQAFDTGGQKFSDGFLKNIPVPGPKEEKDLILWDKKNKNKDSFQYFEKLATFCQKHHVKLVVAVLPVPRETLQKYQKKYQEYDAYFRTYMKKYGIPYWNYNHPDRQIEDFDYSLNAFTDYEGHMNMEQAEDFSVRLAQDLKSL